VWTTIDSLPFLLDQVPSARAFMMVGRGNPEGILARRVSSLQGLCMPNREVLLVPNSPSLWIFGSLCNSRAESKNPSHYNPAPGTPDDAYENFRAAGGKADAVGLWGPAFICARLLAKRKHNEEIFSPKQQDVVDVLVAEKSLLADRPGDIKGMIDVWLNDAPKALKDGGVINATMILLNSGHHKCPRTLEEISEKEWAAAVSKAVEGVQENGVASLDDNVRLFGSGNMNLTTEFGGLFKSASYVLKLKPHRPECAADPRLVRELGATRVTGGEVPATRATVLFAEEKETTLSTENKEILDKWFESLDCLTEEAPHIRVEGHADRRRADNERLSWERADSVANYLKEKHPQVKDRVQPQGKGDKEPVSSGTTPDAYRENRRVVVFIEQD
jgi:outer membrane protein OmpA-like peptidoglycan-associated protein